MDLTTETFKERVFNFEENDQWKFEGDKPAIIDWWAEWCAPCKVLEPTMDKLEEELGDKVDFYKINVDENPELAQAFQIRSIPSILFVPLEGMPQMAVGALPENVIKEQAEKIFGVKAEAV